MNINPKELQKFHDLWAPMIAALPAVINAAESAAEIERHLEIKRAEFAEIDARCRKRQEDAETSVKLALDKTATARQAHVEALAAMDGELKEARASVRAAKSDAATKVAEHQANASTVHEQLLKAKADSAAALQQLQATYDARKAELEAEVATVEAKRVAAEKALDKLREKLG